MRQTLFFIPHEFAGLPLFGGGWLLIGWGILAIILLTWMLKTRGWNQETKGCLPFLLIVAAVIYFVLPTLEVTRVGGGEPLGLPIRGYGVMLLLGVTAGIGVAVYRGRQVGLHPDIIYSLAFWMFLLGIGGARLFWVMQYWDHLNHESWQQTLFDIARFTEGGLVVYGSLFGALLAFVAVTYLRRLRLLQLADVIAPSMLIGLAIGRVGCLLNGCCFGGICTEGPVAINFPRYSSPQQATLSPAYAHQLSYGELHGFQIAATPAAPQPVVTRVDPEGPAARSGLQVGATIKSINGLAISTLEQARQALSRSLPQISVTTAEGQTFAWSIGELPTHSLPVHPTQLYSALNAALLFAVLWFLFPFRTRDGVVFGVLLTLYPVTRFLLEMVRTDELGILGTQFTISQIISLTAVCLMIFYWPYVMTQPRLAHAKAV